MVTTLMTQIVLFCAALHPGSSWPDLGRGHKACMERIDNCILEQPAGRDPVYWFEYCQRLEFDREVR